MKFFSKIINKPNAIIERQMDGFRLIKNTKLCTFINGVLETDDPELIIKLNKRPDLFSTKPWATPYSWRTTEEGIELLKEGERLGIKCRFIRKEYLMKLVAKSKEPVVKKEEVLPKPEKVEIKEVIEGVPNEAYKEAMKLEEEAPKPTIPVVKVDYKEIMRLAKEKGIKGHGVKKQILIKKLKEKGVNING